MGIRVVELQSELSGSGRRVGGLSGSRKASSGAAADLRGLQEKADCLDIIHDIFPFFVKLLRENTNFHQKP